MERYQLNNEELEHLIKGEDVVISVFTFVDEDPGLVPIDISLTPPPCKD